MLTSATFAALGVSEPVRAALAEQGITDPFPVQEAVLPAVAAGEDVLVMSPTGSGKTLAFGLHLVDHARRAGAPSALVLAPTRELAVQIVEELEPLAAARGVRVAVCYGGVGLDAQATKAAKADIVVATPGRLIDLTGRGRVSLGGVRRLVLDEADRMLDMGFMPQVEGIVRQIPRDRQTMLFSATLDTAVMKIADQFTRSPVRLSLQDDRDADDSLSERLDHTFVACDQGAKSEELLGLIAGEDDLVLVFCRTKRGADRLASRLGQHDVDAAAMHGDLSQGARERALRRFSQGRSRVLVATDVAARGIDLDDIGLVINYDPPEDAAGYTHRVGRTARAGRTGRAATLVTPDQADAVGRMARILGLEDAWAATGYAAGAPRVVHASRRRGSVFAPSRPARPRPAAAAPAAPRANRVKRGSRASV